MISITPYDASDLSEILAPSGFATDSIATRTSRNELIGGGTYIDHRGLCHGDRTLSVSLPFTQDAYDKLKALVAVKCMMSTPEGLFSGVIAQMSINSGKLDCSFWIEAQSADYGE